MEYLALTCKTLYDVDILNKRTEIEALKKGAMVIFKDIHEYFQKIYKFKSNIKENIRKYIQENTFGAIFLLKTEKSKYQLNDIILIELLKFTNYTNTKWCQHTAKQIVLMIDSIINTFEDIEMKLGKKTYYLIFTNLIINVCCNDDHEGLFNEISYFKCSSCKKIGKDFLMLDKMYCSPCFDKYPMEDNLLL